MAYHQQDPLPVEWQCLEGKVTNVKKHSRWEYSSSCPACGGKDRFRIFTDGKVRAWCRQCGGKFFPDMFGGPDYGRLDPEQDAAWRAKLEADERQKIQEAEHALALLANEQKWVEYHANLWDKGREYWRSRGVPDIWQDYWELGWAFRRWGGIDSATIPIFHGDEPRNIKHRLERDDCGRYRYEYRTGQWPWLVDRHADLSGEVIAVEGEIKAAVLAVHLDMPEGAIVGLPGAKPGKTTVETLQHAEKVTLVMDPDAEGKVRPLVEALGPERCWVLVTPDKIDDLILTTFPTRGEVLSMLRRAQPAA